MVGSCALPVSMRDKIEELVNAVGITDKKMSPIRIPGSPNDIDFNQTVDNAGFRKVDKYEGCHYDWNSGRNDTER